MEYELIYSSIAVPRITENDIENILKVSRSFNEKNSITGCLLYHDMEFAQIIEGDKAAIRRLFDRIRTDNRHHEVSLIYEGIIKKRQFKNWSMAFKSFKINDFDYYKNVIDLEKFKAISNLRDHTTQGSRLFRLISEQMIEEA